MNLFHCLTSSGLSLLTTNALPSGTVILPGASLVGSAVSSVILGIIPSATSLVDLSVMTSGLPFNTVIIPGTSATGSFASVLSVVFFCVTASFTFDEQ